MLRPLLGLAPKSDEEELERHLLRRCVGSLEEERHRCGDCGRTPLVGEQVHRFARGETVCDLCRPLHAGDPQSTDLVRHSERGHAVRVLSSRLAA